MHVQIVLACLPPHRASLPVAAGLDIRRSSSYCDFKNPQGLLDALLEYWTEVNDRALRSVVQPHEEKPKPRR